MIKNFIIILIDIILIDIIKCCNCTFNQLTYNIQIIQCDSNKHVHLLEANQDVICSVWIISQAAGKSQIKKLFAKLFDY